MPEEGESEKLSIALELSQRGGKEAYVELVLPMSWEREEQLSLISSSDQDDIGKQVCCCFIWVVECSRAAAAVPVSQESCIPPLPASASSCAGSSAGGSCLAPVQLTDT